MPSVFSPSQTKSGVKTMKRTLIGAAVIALMLGVPAIPALADDEGDWGWHMWGWGNGPGGGQGMMMGQGMMGRMAAIDSNNDGVISDDEAAAQVENVYAEMDADDDGELTEEEYMAVRMGFGPGQGRNEARQKQMQERKKARFGEMDADKSGKVSKAEFIAGGKARFLAADADKDGKVTPWEFRAQRWQ
jgi:Ca2+-binding EF-hand superfamily protein